VTAAALLAVGAALCYGVSNFVGPRLARNLPLYPVLISGQVVALAVSGLLVLTELDRGAPSLGEAGAAAAAGAGNAIGLLAFYRAAAVGPLSIAAPLGSLGAVVPVLVGVAEGERLGALKLGAIAIALTGVALAARRGATPAVATPASAAGDRRAAAGDRRAAAGWALVSSLGFGVFLAGMAPAAEAGTFWAVALSRVALLAIFAVVALRLSSPLRVAGRDLPRVMVPGLLLFGGTMLYTAATRSGDLSVVAVLGSLFPVFTVGLAFALLGERLSRVQAAGAVAAMLGGVLLAAAR
jgi:drug/metabolite transporter (DMT)-like permease